jgi:hypothetical protein
VRVLALQAIGKLLRSGVKIEPQELFATIYRIMQPHTLSQPCYLALFSIMLSEDMQASVVTGANGKHSFMLDGTRTFVELVSFFHSLPLS